MIRFGSKYFQIENVRALAADNGDFGLEFRRLCKKRCQEENFLFLRDVMRRRPAQQIYMEYLIPKMAAPRNAAERLRQQNLQAYDATIHFPLGHRPKQHMMETPRRIRVNLGRGLNISDGARAPMIDLAGANRWSEALWRPALNTAVIQIVRFLESNGTIKDYYQSDVFLRLMETLVLPSVQKQHADTLALTNVLSSAVKKDPKLLQFLRYAKASVFFGLDGVECANREQMFRRAAEEMLQGLRDQHGITVTFDSLKTGAWAA